MKATKHIKSTETDGDKWVALVLDSRLTYEPKVHFCGGFHKTKEMAKRSLLKTLFKERLFGFFCYEFDEDKEYVYEMRQVEFLSKIPNFEEKINDVETPKDLFDIFIDDIVCVSVKEITEKICQENINCCVKKIVGSKGFVLGI